MQDAMLLEIVFVAVLALGVAALFWVMVRQSSEKIVRQYRQMAQHFEVELTTPEAQLGGFVRSEPFIHGRYHGREMSISVPGKGLQNTRQIETIFKLEVRDRALQWQMSASGLLGGLRQRDSGQSARWSSGDEQFDAAVKVRGNDAQRLLAILDAERRATLSDILTACKGTLTLREGVLAYAEFGLIADDAKRQRFERVAVLLYDLAERAEQG
jgi:hypothetical protein